MTLDGLDPAILGPAMVAGLLVLATHVPLGREVLRRGIIFIDLAIAQIAGVGVLAAHVMNLSDNALVLQLVAYGAALAGAILLFGCERKWPAVQEAIIGSAFVVAASVGVLLLSGNPQAGEHLKELLVGQILWVDYPQLLHVAVIYVVVLLLWQLLRVEQSRLLFYLLFAITVTASVQLVGVYLVFASLIIPALAVRSCVTGAVWRGVLTGAAGYAVGLLLSALLDLPSGAVIVLSLTVLAVVVSRACASQQRRSREVRG
jgi:zinc/manganese transport system permease protein